MVACEKNLNFDKGDKLKINQVLKESTRSSSTLSGQKLCTKIIHTVLQTSVRLFKYLLKRNHF